MVATRSGRVVSVDALPSDGQAEVKATRPRRAAGSKSAVKAPRTGEQARPASPYSEESNLQVYKAESVVKFSIRQTSQPVSPASPPSTSRTQHASPEQEPAVQAAIRPRRLSMREVVIEATDIPLPEEVTLVTESRPVKQPPVRRPGRHAWQAIPLGLLLTTALTLGGAYMLCNVSLPHSLQAAVQPVCQTAQPGIARLSSMRDQLRSKSQEQWTAAREGAQSAYKQGTQWVHTQYDRILSAPVSTRLSNKYQDLQQGANNLLSGNHATASLDSFLPQDAFRATVEQTPGLPDVTDIYQHVREVKDKGTSVLLACGTVCGDVQRDLTAAVLQPQHLCLVDGSIYNTTGSAGSLQLHLARCLAASPASVVLISSFEQMNTESLAVLSNAMSEGGGLQLKGHTVDTTKALYITLVTAGSGVAAVPSDLEHFETKVKGEVQQAVASGKSSDTHDAATVALALRRRFDFVLPSAAIARIAVNTEEMEAMAAAVEPDIVHVGTTVTEAPLGGEEVKELEEEHTRMEAVAAENELHE